MTAVRVRTHRPSERCDSSCSALRRELSQHILKRLSLRFSGISVKVFFFIRQYTAV